MGNLICWAHCYMEFPTQETFSEHIDKVVSVRAKRNRRNLYKKLKAEFEPTTPQARAEEEK